MVKTVKKTLRALQHHMNSWWYPPALAFMAAVDLFVIVIPTDALLVSACMLKPKKWFLYAVVVSIGSAVGVFILAAVLRTHGLPLLLHLAPHIESTHAWKWTIELMANWGPWAVFLIALSPIMQHPAIALAAFAGMPLWKISGFVLAGRLIKYLLWAYLSTHAPWVLAKFLPIEKSRHELEDEEAENAAPSAPPVKMEK
ncbi:MAG: YqaA family protein [Bdellovibrionota bacterium]